MKFYVGCSGWSYTAWQGPFYPSNMDNSKWLEYYSKVFDYVEIDSSFYRIPNIFTVKNWSKTTPSNFRFTAKFPKVITHEKRLKNVDNQLSLFFKAMEPLHDKILALLIQLPPSLEITEGLQRLREIIPILNNKFRYAVEIRNQSWFQDLAYNFFANNNLCMVWSQLVGIRIPPIVTSDFLYIRFIGDRTIQEKNFGRIQKDRASEMRKWSRQLMRVQKEETKLNLAIVTANNHYAGFGPATANMFRKIIGLPDVNWIHTNKIKEQHIYADPSPPPSSSLDKQSTISDFLD
ncbi:MAG TPA: DUF72 domain-containing protein [Nitrososphaeraceae archaeon]|nr:DUF72 domain-containing protein [Nitrososphaeraceae archaeon]